MRKQPLKVLEITPSNSQNSHENHTIKFSVSENLIVEVSSSYLEKCGISHFLPEDKSGMRIYLFAFWLFFFIPRGDHVDPVALECRKRADSNGN